MILCFLLRAVIHEFGVRGSACYDPRSPHFQEVSLNSIPADLCSDLVPKITCKVLEPGLIYRLCLEHPASTLPTRFPAALGIGHGLRYALRYCIRSSTRRCLSMLRNTGDGNELALPATNAW